MPLSTKAANLAKLVINAPYIGDGDTYGGKGWDLLRREYVAVNLIFNGYNFWNNKIRTIDFGAGLDCSGLVQWAFNRSFDPKRNLLRNVIRYDGADGQYKNNSEAITENDLQPGDLLFLDKNSNGIKDHVAMYVGDNVTFDIVEAFSPQQGIRSTTKVEFEARIGFVASQDLRRVALSPAIGGSLQAGSPIDLVVTDPDGFTITATTAIQTDEEFLREVTGELYYSESELGSDGKPEDVVYWPVQKTGDYIFTAIPEVGASPTATYSLTFQTGSTTMLLAQNISVSQIPSRGYGITIVATGTISSFIPVAIDIKPGNYPNSINLKSNGVVPVAILGSATFDVRQIDATTINVANAPVKLKNNGQPMTSYSDINGDGFIDLTVHVSTQALQLTATSTKTNLVGRITNGTIIKGSASVRIVPQ
ncbi:MAG: NlpC/P60 family protein [bacterium]|nr:NlpC/P60 family protein [bacterium]